jgi:hypothetical protein
MLLCASLPEWYRVHICPQPALCSPGLCFKLR